MRSLPSWTSLEYLGLALYTAASRQHFAPLKDSSAMAEARSSITVCRLMSAPLDIFLLACLLACVRACGRACLLACSNPTPPGVFRLFYCRAGIAFRKPLLWCAKPRRL